MSKCYLQSKKWPCFLEDQNCQKRNRKWACVHELKCLHVFKQIETNDSDKKGLFEKLVEKLAQDNVFSGIGKGSEGSCEYSIKQKIRNINSLSGKKIEEIENQSNASETTRKIFEKVQELGNRKTGKKIESLEKNIN